MEPAKKRAKGKPELPESMVVRFRQVSSDSNAPASTQLPQLDVPLDSTVNQLERLVNELLGNEDRVPFAFYVDSNEIVGSLKLAITDHKLSTETVMNIQYEPLALFRVHPVTRCTDSMPGHTEALLHVSFSPCGTQLASGGGDTTVRFWDVSSRTPKFVCKGHKNHVLCTAWSPNGKRFASADKNGEIRVWDPTNGQQIGKPLIGHKRWVSSISWEPFHLNSACERLITGSKDGTAKVWNVRSGRCEATLGGHSDAVECVRWGGEGLMYTASRDKTILVWGARSNNTSSCPFILVRTLAGHAHRINHIALSTDYLCRTGAFDHTGAATDATAEESFELAVKRYSAAKAAHNLSICPFERLVSCSDDLTLYLWHPTVDKKPLQRMHGHQQPVTHICFSPDGRYLASASFDKKVKLWCGRTGTFIATLTGHVGRVYQVAWAPDSRLLCSASQDSTLKIWEVRSPTKAKETLPGHFDEVYALDWSPNGELVASGGKDRVLKIFAQ